MDEQTDHTIEYGSTGSWQAGDIYWALCACGWTSRRDSNREIVEADVRRHLAEAGAAD